VRGTPRTDPDGRSLAHPVLIADDWRQSEPRDKDGAVGVQVAIGGSPTVEGGQDYIVSTSLERVIWRYKCCRFFEVKKRKSG
jgi:hypothetical protein